MRAVLDASAAINIVTGGNFSDMIVEGLDMCNFVYAPTLYYSEVGNGLLHSVRAGVLSYSKALTCYEDALSFVTSFVDIKTLSLSTFREAYRLNHSICDIYYFELAKQTGAHLVTLDQKLIRLAQEHELRYIQFEDVSNSFFS